MQKTVHGWKFIAEGHAKEISQAVDFPSRTEFCPVTRLDDFVKATWIG
jgi:hypothetical protein